MKRNNILQWMLLAITALTAACTEEDIAKGQRTASTTEGGYTYTLHLDMPSPDADATATRAVGTWADGSKVEFFFYTEVSQTGYKGIPGTATYNAKDGSWTLRANTQIPTNAANKDCEARYFKPGADTSNDFFTAVYFATSTYTLQGDTDVYADVTLKPCNWRLRFKGTAGTQLTFTATNIRHCTGDSIHATTIPQAAQANMDLTVGDDGYTYYIYGALANASTDATLTITLGGERYSRTISSTVLYTSRSVLFDVPQISDYAAKGWELIDEGAIKAIDLGLPSGTLWANMNIGAESPEDYGLFFAWGETEGFTIENSDGRSFEWASYKWMTEGQSSGLWVNKYQMEDGVTDGCWYNSDGQFIGDDLLTLLPNDDAATQNWGTNWRMPTLEDIQELLNNTTYTWTTRNSVNGALFTSTKNGNSIFIPAAGYSNKTNLISPGNYGFVWSSSVNLFNTCYAQALGFGRGYHNFYEYGRQNGQSVRPVQVAHAVEAFLIVSPESLSFGPSVDSQDVTVTCNNAWTASSDQSWCTVSPSKGANNGIITVTAEENTNTTSRTATITVTAGTLTKQVVVTQAGKNQIDVTPFGDDENWD